MKKIAFLLLTLILISNVSSAENWTGEPASFDFKDIDIRDLFRFFADLSEMNLILHAGVKGTITLKLTDVPWDQALDLITKNHGLGYTIDGNVIWIASLEVISQETKNRMEAEKQRILSAPLETRIIPLSYAKATDIERIVRRLLTPKGTVIVDPRTNTLIITDVVVK